MADRLPADGLENEFPEGEDAEEEFREEDVEEEFREEEDEAEEGAGGGGGGGGDGVGAAAAAALPMGGHIPLGGADAVFFAAAAMPIPADRIATMKADQRAADIHKRNLAKARAPPRAAIVHARVACVGGRPQCAGELRVR